MAVGDQKCLSRAGVTASTMSEETGWEEDSTAPHQSLQEQAWQITLRVAVCCGLSDPI